LPPPQIKRASDARLGVPSQCIVTRSAGIGPNTEPRGRLQYCANVALKINAKLDGVNVRLAGGWRGGGLGRGRGWVGLMCWCAGSAGWGGS
jgi:eukaryotic translation initiation factor 2C